VLHFAKRLLFGTPLGFGDVFRIDFPIVPWFALYLVGTVFGERIGSRLGEGGTERAARYVGWAGIAFLSLAGVIVAIRAGLSIWLGDVPSSGASVQLYTQKLPPTLLYYMVYGSTGLIMLYIFIRYQEHALIRRAALFSGVIGRTSLSTFVLQYFIYFTGFVLLRLDYTPFWPLYFVASVAIIYIAGYYWDKNGWNRYLVVPYRRLFPFAARR